MNPERTVAKHMWGLHTWVSLGVGLALLAFLVYLGCSWYPYVKPLWPPLDSGGHLDINKITTLARVWTAAFALLALIIAAAGGFVAYRQFITAGKGLANQFEAAAESTREHMKSRELEVALAVLRNYLDDSRLRMLRRFVYMHWSTVEDRSSIVGWDKAVQEAGATFLRQRTVGLTGPEQDSTAAITTDDIEMLVNSINHVCLLLCSHKLEHLYYDFYDPISGMWRALGRYVLEERVRRQQHRGAPVNFFGSHFEFLGRAFSTPEFVQKLRTEAAQRGMTSFNHPGSLGPTAGILLLLLAPIAVLLCRRYLV